MTYNWTRKFCQLPTANCQLETIFLFDLIFLLNKFNQILRLHLKFLDRRIVVQVKCSSVGPHIIRVFMQQCFVGSKELRVCMPDAAGVKSAVEVILTEIKNLERQFTCVAPEVFIQWRNVVEV